jgi:predicted nucleotidyltransferase
MDLEKQMAEIFGLPVDLVVPKARTNPIRRRNIPATVEPLYAA